VIAVALGIVVWKREILKKYLKMFKKKEEQ
jgi:hypothetical protein